MIFEQLQERELLRLYSKQRSDNVIMEEGEEGYSIDRQVVSEMMELSVALPGAPLRPTRKTGFTFF